MPSKKNTKMAILAKKLIFFPEKNNFASKFFFSKRSNNLFLGINMDQYNVYPCNKNILGWFILYIHIFKCFVVSRSAIRQHVAKGAKKSENGPFFAQNFFRDLIIWLHNWIEPKYFVETSEVSQISTQKILLTKEKKLRKKIEKVYPFSIRSIGGIFETAFFDIFKNL